MNSNDFDKILLDKLFQSFKKNLGNRAIAYLNVDIAVQGKHVS